MDPTLVKKVLNDLSLVISQIPEVNEIYSSSGCVDGVIIGTGRSDFTKSSTLYNLTIGKKDFALIDIPGIEGDESAYEDIIKDALEQAHMIFYVNGSGKKIENDSLNKIRKYMRDGTSVYAVFNTHCKAKKERIPGIDKMYSEELKIAYKKQKGVITQTESELISFLGENFKGSISLNGLLAFCSVAFKNEYNSSIKEEPDKNLRGDQKKYLNEYNMNREQMFIDSHLLSLCESIEKKIYTYEEDIKKENIKKLKNRMNIMIEKIMYLKTREIRKIDGFISVYDEFERSCYNAKEDFIRDMEHVAFNAANEAFYDLLNELFDKIEQDNGRTKDQEISSIVERRKDDVALKIQKGVNDKINNAQKTFIESIEDAQTRLKKDLERENLQFEVALSSEDIKLNISFEDCLKYNLKDFGKHAFTIGSLALSGAALGSIIPGLGTALGAAIGAVVGVLSGVWNFFVSKEKRINNAKDKIRRAIDEQIYNVSNQLKEEMRKMNYEIRINEVYDSIYEDSEIQKNRLKDVKRLLNNVENEMIEVYRNIA